VPSWYRQGQPSFLPAIRYYIAWSPRRHRKIGHEQNNWLILAPYSAGAYCPQQNPGAKHFLVAIYSVLVWIMQSRDGPLCSVIICCRTALDGISCRGHSPCSGSGLTTTVCLASANHAFCVQLKLMSHQKLHEGAQNWADCNICIQHTQDKRDIRLSQFDNSTVITHLSYLTL